MELPSRPKHDRYTKAGRYNQLEKQLRNRPATSEISTIVAYSFDHRTRLGPFLYADMSLLTAGPRAVAASLINAGFEKTRIVLRQWNPEFRVSEARIDGVPPHLLLVSSMQIHSASAYEMIVDAHKLGDNRPLILAGGAKAIYEPWDFFGVDLERNFSADVAVTGEEFVTLELLDRLMEYRAGGEHLRKTFHRLRRSGLLDDIPGLVFREGDEKSPLGRLINTGIQRMVQDLDELPHPVVSLGVIEPPHRRHYLSAKPLAIGKIRRHVGMISLVTTHGCKFHCSYCPIPAYNQFTFRFKSPERLRDEIKVVAETTGIHNFFGTDDNFFNSRETVDEIFSVLSKGKVGNKPFRDTVFFGTEGTEFDVYKNQDLLPMCRDGGLRAIWFGIEDMTAELIKKGQSPEKTKTLFKLLSGMGICPMPMMMHHDGQPLKSRGNLYGLINQVKFLRKSGSVSVQVTILTPSVGSKGYQEPYKKGMVIDKAGEHEVEDYQFDGNHCVATDDPSPWRKQLNIYLAYATFYNPLNFVKAIASWKDPLWTYKVLYQIYGMAGLVQSFAKGFGWLKNLWRGPVVKRAGFPRRRLEMVPPPVTPAMVAQATPQLQPA
ncbi:MAG: radical SAM protein [Planctomycetes bacterium]|nr:radical SAM protein [Planctomycetota bacterium]